MHKQATEKRSHFYVAKCCKDSINEIERLRRELAEARELLLELYQNDSDRYMAKEIARFPAEKEGER